jgi:hypothetical protein
LVLDFASGVSMKQEAYRFAYDEANAELGSILGHFEQLRLRKEQIEGVVAALKPFLDLEADPTASTTEPVDYEQPEPVQLVNTPIALPMQFAPEPFPEPVEIPVAPAPMFGHYAADASSDAFQQRIDSVLWGWTRKREGMIPAV